MGEVNRTIVILGATTLVFGSASAYLYNDLRETRAEAVGLQARVADLEKALPATAAPIARSVPTLPTNPFGPPVEAAPETNASPANATGPKRVPGNGAGMPQQAAALAGGAFAMATTGFGFGPRMAGGWEQQRKMLEDPDYRDAMKRQQKMMLPRMYPELQQALQLDPRQTDELYELLAEQQIRQMTEQRSPPFQNRNSPPDPAAVREWQETMQRTQASYENEVASLLGDAGYQQWKNYKSTMPARSQIRELRSTLESAGVPLQPEQSEKLVAAIASQQQSQMQSAVTWRAVPPTGLSMVAPAPVALNGVRSDGQIDRAAFMEQQVERTRAQQQQLRSTIAPHLSSQQLEQFERMQATQLEMQEINLKMMRAQAAAEARGELPPSSQNGVIAQGVFVGR